MFKQLTNLILIVLWINTTTYAEDNPTIVKSGKLGNRSDGATPISNRRALNNNTPNFSSIDYKVNEDEMNKTIRIPANPIKFPLFKEDKKDIDRLIKKFNNKKKREIVFSISSREPLKKWRPDLTQTIRDTQRVNCFSQIPNTPCINPDYIPIGIRMPEDDEYFYVRKNETSPVRRYKKTLRQKMESKIKCIYY